MKTSKLMLALTLLSNTLAPGARQSASPPQTPTTRTERGAAGDEDEVERVNVNLVSAAVSVTDRDGRFVAGLRPEDFRVTDNGKEQQVTYFAAVEQPFSVLLLMDTSGSTQLRLQDMQEAAIRFVQQLRPQDRVLPVAFDNEPVALLNHWSGDQNRLAAAIRGAKTGMTVAQKDVTKVNAKDGKTYTVLRVSTRLYDALHQSIGELRRIKGRKALILFTDGMDTGSREATLKSTLAEAEELDALVYTVNYGRWAKDPGRFWRPQLYPTAVEAESYLKGLAEKTGGRVYTANSLSRIAKSFAAIAEELRRTYSIGYSPPPLARPGERREIKIKVRRGGVAVRARSSYVYTPR